MSTIQHWPSFYLTSWNICNGNTITPDGEKLISNEVGLLYSPDLENYSLINRQIMMIEMNEIRDLLIQCKTRLRLSKMMKHQPVLLPHTASEPVLRPGKHCPQVSILSTSDQLLQPPTPPEKRSKSIERSIYKECCIFEGVNVWSDKSGGIYTALYVI